MDVIVNKGITEVLAADLTVDYGVDDYLIAVLLDGFGDPLSGFVLSVDLIIQQPRKFWMSL